MELREAVEKARQETTAWALTVTCGEQVHAHFQAISYDNVVKASVVQASDDLSKKVVDRVWPQMQSGISHEQLAEVLRGEALALCWRFFAIGWVMGAPEYQAMPKTSDTFYRVMAATPEEEMRLLEQQFAGEDFLRERFLLQLSASATMVSWIFSQRGLTISEETVASWCTITASLPTFEAYELGVRSRVLCEEDLFLSTIESELD